MVNGSDAYGSFYCTTPQSILPNDYIVFENMINVLNLSFEENKREIKIAIPGIYTFNITAQFDQPCQVAIFINDVPDLATVTASNSGAHIVTVHQLLSLKAGDLVSFRNYISNVTLTTSIPASGTILPSQNVDLTIYRIAPLPEPCCLPPIPNTKAWYYFNSSDSECTDTEEPNCVTNTKEVKINKP